MKFTIEEEIRYVVFRDGWLVDIFDTQEDAEEFIKSEEAGSTKR